MHNYGVAATGAFGLIKSIFYTHVLLLTGAGSGVGAAVIFHKRVAIAKAAIPDVVPANQANRQKLLDLLWADLGRAATDDQIKAVKALGNDTP